MKNFLVTNLRTWWRKKHLMVKQLLLFFHNGNPGPMGIAFTFGDTNGILNLRPDRWELGDTGIVQNAFDENVGVLSKTANSTVKILFFVER